MNENKAIKTLNITKKSKPRFIVTREYSGGQSMREAFEQVMEKRVSEQLKQWLDSKID